LNDIFLPFIYRAVEAGDWTDTILGATHSQPKAHCYAWILFSNLGWQCENHLAGQRAALKALSARRDSPMKRLLLCSGVLLAATSLFAQMSMPPAPKAPPKSPAAKAEAKIAGATITIDYSSPRVRGREGKIFTKDGLIGHDPTYPVWRAGANAATTLTTDADVKIGSLLVPKGTYTIYVDLTDPAAWVLVVNKETKQWGTVYDKTQDLGRVPMKMDKTKALVEELAYTLTAKGKGGHLTLAWENVTASVPVTAAN
jgi:hypothetical protein